MAVTNPEAEPPQARVDVQFPADTPGVEICAT